MRQSFAPFFRACYIFDFTACTTSGGLFWRSHAHQRGSRVLYFQTRASLQKYEYYNIYVREYCKILPQTKSDAFKDTLHLPFLELYPKNIIDFHFYLFYFFNFELENIFSVYTFFLYIVCNIYF